MENVFSLRMGQQTAEILVQLAQKTHRSRAGVIRWLIHKSAEEFNIVSKSIENKTKKKEK